MRQVYTITLPVYAYRQTADGRGTVRGEQTGETKHQVEVVVDIDAIAKKLGAKCARNKSGKSTALEGAVKLKRLN